jgi:hypothetical protein
MTSELPIGRRFSHVYIERGSPMRDSKRFRRRLAEHLRLQLSATDVQMNMNEAIGNALQRELGISVPDCPEVRNLNRWLAENTLKERCLAVMPLDTSEQACSMGLGSGSMRCTTTGTGKLAMSRSRLARLLPSM